MGMTNEEAIEWIKGLRDGWNDRTNVTACNMAIKALEQEPCEDCISRTELLSKIDAERKYLLDLKMDGAEHIVVHHARRIIEDMPFVTPQPKTGRWIYTPKRRLDNETDEGRVYITDYRCTCSECGGDFGFRKMSDAYCKYCGARMEVEE